MACVHAENGPCEIHNPFCAMCVGHPTSDCSPAYHTKSSCGGCCGVPDDMRTWYEDTGSEFITPKEEMSLGMWIDPATILGRRNENTYDHVRSRDIYESIGAAPPRIRPAIGSGPVYSQVLRCTQPTVYRNVLVSVLTGKEAKEECKWVWEKTQ